MDLPTQVAERESFCSYCDQLIAPGDTIATIFLPDKVWVHEACAKTFRDRVLDGEE